MKALTALTAAWSQIPQHLTFSDKWRLAAESSVRLRLSGNLGKKDGRQRELRLPQMGKEKQRMGTGLGYHIDHGLKVTEEHEGWESLIHSLILQLLTWDFTGPRHSPSPENKTFAI